MGEQTGRTGKCTNFGNCTLADTGVDLQIPDGAAPVCTECGRGLMVSQPARDRSKLIGGIVALLVIAALVLLAMKFLWGYLMPTPEPAAPAVPALAVSTQSLPPQTQDVTPPPPQAETPPPPRAPAAAVYRNMVKVADFWIDKTEVSVGEYRAFAPGYKAPTGFTDDLPVVDVTWEDATRFAQAKGNRLCRESEWLFALGDEVGAPAQAALSGGTMDKPRRVADERDANSHGLLNMVGNVSEWVDPGTDEAAFLGGYWYWGREGRPVSDLKRANRLGTTRAYHHYIGFRTCRDAGTSSN